MPRPYNLQKEEPVYLKYFKEGGIREIVKEKPKTRDLQFPYIGEAIYLSKNFTVFTVTIDVNPVLIVESSYLTPYKIINPSRSVANVTSTTVFNGTADDGTVSGSVGVGGFEYLHVFLNVTSIGVSSWDIIMQSYNPLTNGWVDYQVIWSGVNATGDYQPQTLGPAGLASDFRVRFSRTSGSGTITCSISGVLKGGLGGNNAGLVNVVYLGNQNVSPNYGYPLLESHSVVFLIEAGCALYGVSYAPININVMKFQ